MNSEPQIRTSELLEWDTPWNFWLLTASVCIVGLWILWQIIRECRIAGSRWGILFVLLRGIVASILLWMLLGPTSVVVREETRPRTLAVFLDTSSSMTLSDPSDPLADSIWNESIAERSSAASQSNGLADETSSSKAGDDRLLLQVHSSVQAASRAALFADASCLEADRLSQLVRHQATTEERVSAAARWCELIETANAWLQKTETPSPISGVTEPADRPGLLDNTVRSDNTVSSIGQELQSMMTDKDWLAGDDIADQTERIAQLEEQCDEFSARCHILVQEVMQKAEAKLATENRRIDTSAHSTDSRFDRAISALTTSIGQWEGDSDGRFRIQLFQFAESVSELPERNWDTAVRDAMAAGQSEGTVRQTDLEELLKQIRDDSGQSDIAAAVVLSDGRQTSSNAIDPRELV